MDSAMPSAMSVLGGITRSIWEPRDPLPPVAWAEEHRSISAEGAASARPGPFRASMVPYLRQPLADIIDPRIAEIAVQKSAQTGATESLGISAAIYYATALREPCMVVYPAEKAGMDVNKRRLIPGILSCPPAFAMVDNPHFDLKETEVSLRGVSIFFAWAGSKKTLKSNPVARIVADEIDEYEDLQSVLANLRDRQKTFASRTLLKFSTPENDQDGITREYENAEDRFRFCVPCPITGRYFEPWSFGLLRWPGGTSAEPAAAAARCWMQSPFVRPPKGQTITSAGQIPERIKPWMVRHGVWLRPGEAIESDGRILETIGAPDGETPWASELDADWLRDEPKQATGSTRSAVRRLKRFGRVMTEEDAAAVDRLGLKIVGGENGREGLVPPARTRGYRFNGLVSLVSSEGWGGIVHKYVQAKGRPSPDFWKGDLGFAPGLKGDSADVAAIRSLSLRTPEQDDLGAYRIGEMPPGTALAYAGVDVQKDCLKIAVWAFGPDQAPPALADAVRLSRDESARFRDVVEALASMRLDGARTVGRPVRPSRFFVDSGHFTEDVYWLVDELNRRRARSAVSVKGAHQLGRGERYKLVQVDDQYDMTGRRRVRRAAPVSLLQIHVDLWKEYVFTRLRPSEANGEDLDLLAEIALASGAEVGFAAPADAERQRSLFIEGASKVRIPDTRSWDSESEDGRWARDFEMFAAEMTSEVRVNRRVGGRERTGWEKRQDHQPNDWWDATVYAMAGAHWLGVHRLTSSDLAESRTAAHGPAEPARRAGGASGETVATRPQLPAAATPARGAEMRGTARHVSDVSDQWREWMGMR